MISDGAVSSRVDLVLSRYEVCCYGLVVSLTAISLCDARRLDERLRLFSLALDDFENGLFELALERARKATHPEIAGGGTAGAGHDLEALRTRLHRLLARRPGRA